MNDETTDLDQADEEILTYTVFDAALEAAASPGTRRGVLSSYPWPPTQIPSPDCFIATNHCQPSPHAAASAMNRSHGG
jgi:hypothetical protein